MLDGRVRNLESDKFAVFQVDEIDVNDDASLRCRIYEKRVREYKTLETYKTFEILKDPLQTFEGTTIAVSYLNPAGWMFVPFTASANSTAKPIYESALKEAYERVKSGVERQVIVNRAVGDSTFFVGEYGNDVVIRRGGEIGTNQIDSGVTSEAVLIPYSGPVRLKASTGEILASSISRNAKCYIKIAQDIADVGSITPGTYVIAVGAAEGIEVGSVEIGVAELLAWNDYFLDE